MEDKSPDKLPNTEDSTKLSPDNNPPLQPNISISSADTQEVAKFPPTEQHGIMPANPKRTHKSIIAVLIILIILVAGATAFYLYHSRVQTKSVSKPPIATVNAKTTSPPAVTKPKTVALLYINPTSKLITLADVNDTKLSATTYSGRDFASFVANTPLGGVLLALDSYGATTNYLYIDKAGMEHVLSQTVNTALGSANGNRGGSTIEFINENEVLYSVCAPKAQTNDCKLVRYNLLTGASSTLLDTSAPSASDTGSAVFSVIGVSPDGQTGFLEIVGPSSLGSSPDGVYKIDLTTNKTTTVAPITYGNANISLSPDAKTIVYQTGNGPSVLHILNIETGKETTVAWSRPDSVGGFGGNLAWSSDSSKLLFKGTTGTDASSTSDIAYLDLSNSTIVDLTSVADTTRYSVDGLGWLNNSTAIYDVTTAPAATPSNFTNGTSVVYHLDISTKQAIPDTSAPGAYVYSIWH